MLLPHKLLCKAFLIALLYISLLQVVSNFDFDFEQDITSDITALCCLPSGYLEIISF